MFPHLNYPIYSGWVWNTPVIPNLYWNAYSSEERIKNIYKLYAKLEEYINESSEEINSWAEGFAEEIETSLKNIMEMIEDEYKEKIDEWITEDAPKIIDEALGNVYFGLNEEGYFVAYISDNWNDIIFDTGYEYRVDTYGRLILRWNVDNSNDNVNQRPENWG